VNMRRLVGILILLLLGAAYPVKAKTDQEIKQEIIRQSIAGYAGNCPCPYNTDRAGRRCGKRSAHSRPGGYAPLCYESDVTAQMVAGYRRRIGEQPKRESPAARNAARKVDEGSTARRRISSTTTVPIVEPERAPNQAGSNPYFVQVGAFKRSEQTARLTNQLSLLGYAHILLPGSDYVRVLVGPFDTEADALATKSKLEQQGHSGYIRNDIEAPTNGPSIDSGEPSSRKPESSQRGSLQDCQVFGALRLGCSPTIDSSATLTAPLDTAVSETPAPSGNCRQYGPLSVGCEDAELASSSPLPSEPAVSDKPSCAENGSCYGDISPSTGRPKTVHVQGYYRKDGTYVRGHYRSSPRRRK
jgi:cell division septation protein DedD